MFKNSYIITNRTRVDATSYNDIKPLDGGKMWFYNAMGQYTSDASAYHTSLSPSAETRPTAFYLNALAQDLLTTKDANGKAHLCVLIEGLGNLFNQNVAYLANLGQYLAAYSSYKGLVIGFDWPSYGGFDSALHYASGRGFPPTATSGTIRDNINGSTDAFVNFVGTLQSLKDLLQGQLVVDVICHSEGNYMMALGMRAVAAAGLTSLPLRQVMLCAADINNAALDISRLGPEGQYVGWGSHIAKNVDRVTVYYSAHDAALQLSENALGGSHNAVFPGRLGYEGPHSVAALEKNVVPVDCTHVVNVDEVERLGKLGYLPSSFLTTPDSVNGSTHLLYMYTPQILQDLAQAMAGAATVEHRVANGDGSSTMQLVTNIPKATIPPVTIPADATSFFTGAKKLTHDKPDGTKH